MTQRLITESNATAPSQPRPSVDSHWDTLFSLAQSHHRAGALEHSRVIYEQLLHSRPQSGPVLHALGLIAFALLDYDTATNRLNQALDISPDQAVLYYDRGVVFHSQGLYQVAIQNYNLALFLDRTLTGALVNRGLAREALSLDTLALEDFELALSTEPSEVGAWFNKANLLKKHALHEGAIRCYLIAVRINPLFWQARTNLGLAYFETCAYEQAVNAYSAAVAVNQSFAALYFNRANSFRALNESFAAHQDYERAIALDPSLAAAYANRGLVFKDQNLLKRARQDYLRALRIEPKLVDAAWNLAIVHLMQGEWLQGWEGYELRFTHNELKTSVGVKTFAAKRCTSLQDLRGKSILVYCEQGLGDALQFSRYIEKLAAHAGKIYFEVPSALVNLFQSLAPYAQLTLSSDTPPTTDYYCALLSLPKLFQTTVASVPLAPTLELNAAERARWGARVHSALRLQNHSAGIGIGLAWSGNPKHTNDHNRSLPLRTLLEHLPPEFTYFVVQKEVRAEDLELLRTQRSLNIVNLSDQFNDMSDTACLCSALDLIISVDTSAAHLSATLGRNTWILLPYSPDWRWLIEANTSPWYPSVRLFRQASRAAWAEVVTTVADALRAHFALPAQSKH